MSPALTMGLVAPACQAWALMTNSHPWFTLHLVDTAGRSIFGSRPDWGKACGM